MSVLLALGLAGPARAQDSGETLEDADGDGFTVAEGDCDDDEIWANPGQEELCDDIDNDCDEAVDEDGVCDDALVGPCLCACDVTAGSTGTVGGLALVLGIAMLRRREEDREAILERIRDALPADVIEHLRRRDPPA